MLLAIRRSDKRMDQVDKRMDDLRTDVKEMRSEILHRVDTVQRDLIARVDRVADTLHDIHLMLGRHDARLDALEREKK